MDEDFTQKEEGEEINPIEEKLIIPEGEEKEIAEKKEFLKREEIVTLRKDAAKLRELEAQKEREKIASLKPEEEIREIKVKEELKTEKEIPVTLIPKILPKKPSSFQKILVRAGMVLTVLLIIGGFFYWFFAIKKVEGPKEEITSPGEETTTTTATTTPEVPEIIIPFSLITADATETIEIMSLAEATTSLSNTLTKNLGENTFTRVLIKNTEQNKILGLKEFFEAFEIASPQGFLDKLNNDFTLFLYSGKNLNRLGFVAEIKELEGFATSTKAWESTMEKDTEKLFAVLGKTSTATYSYFKTASYKGKTFRYISFPPTNFGICWSTINNYFLLTSSGESMIKLIEKVP
jgi:hypothetical protein